MNLRERIEAVLSKWDATDIVDPEDREALVDSLVSAIEDSPGRRVKIGECGVDSGQLMIMDPCYVASEWLGRNDAKDVECRFWGRDHEEMAEVLKADGMTVEKVEEPHVWRVSQDGWSPSDIQTRIRNHSGDKESGLWVVTDVRRESTYDKCCDLTTGRNQGGQLHYKRGHAGMGVVSRTGFGDGVYDVFTHIVDFGDLGERVAKLEVVLVPEEEWNESA